MRILYGLHQPDEGRILRDGAEELGLLLAGVYPEKQKGREQERNSLAGRRGRLLEPLNGSPSNTLVSKRRGLARRQAAPEIEVCIPKAISPRAQPKQLPEKPLEIVPSCLPLATFSIQFAAIVNTSLGLPHRYLSDIATAFQ